jgi:GTP-binding protein HflX
LLHAALHEALGSDLCHCRLRLSPSQGRARARLFQAGAVVGQQSLDEGWLELEIRLRRHELARICREEGIEIPAETAPCAAAGPFLQSHRLTAVS